jgi:hypothetical protein
MRTALIRRTSGPHNGLLPVFTTPITLGHTNISLGENTQVVSVHDNIKNNHGKRKWRALSPKHCEIDGYQRLRRSALYIPPTPLVRVNFWVLENLMPQYGMFYSLNTPSETTC